MDKINQTIETLRKENREDNESVHSSYDKVLEAIAEHYAPESLAEIKKIVEGIDFWYA
jgi:hypothetical protein